jgi:hypothetical protein
MRTIFFSSLYYKPGIVNQCIVVRVRALTRDRDQFWYSPVTRTRVSGGGGGGGCLQQTARAGTGHGTLFENWRGGSTDGRIITVSTVQVVLLL